MTGLPQPQAQPAPEGRSSQVSPRATYRLQFRNGVDFDAAARLAPYLARLGVSHLYSSPYLEAAPGSTHGYDVVDPARVEPTLGGEEGLTRLRKALADAGLGEVLDVVPNHMAIPGKENPWWWDVLENGPASLYARFFDVDWDPPEAYLRNRVLLPILGDHYGRVLEAGDLRLEREGAAFSIRYVEHALPVAPRSLDRMLGAAAQRLARAREQHPGQPPESPDARGELAFLARSFGQLPPSEVSNRESARRRHRDKAVLHGLLERLLDTSPAAAVAIDEEIASINADVDRLDELIGRQNYRLAYWRAAGQELGYRRFFDVTSLVGIRQEDPDVFEMTHPLIGAWLQDGELDGLRIDHPDGLRDPKEYFERVRSMSPRAWLVAEKILEPGERLREDWPIAGTTGYDFMWLVNSLFVDRANEAAMTRTYADFTGETRTFGEVALDSKRLILREVLATELVRLAALLLDICERHRRYRDYTRRDLHEALLEVVACFPVYRAYVRPAAGEVHAPDIRAVDEAIDRAGRERTTIDSRLLEFIRALLVLEIAGDLEAEFVLRFQQLTGAVMAKGVEDTAFYRYLRLTSLNEVGGDPGVFGIGPDAFHRQSEDRQAIWPLSMLATSTHDTKRSEDVRARISLLSEIPDRWAATVERWSSLVEPHKTAGLPDRNTEWLYYQTLVGAWPLAADRALAYMEKATREAKCETSWSAPNAEFDAAVRRFVEGTLDDPEFCDDVEAFVGPLMRPGQVTSLAQTLLKLTAPGVPDVYQGTELWDLSLVDPDNRRPVDFGLRARLLDELDGAEPADAVGIVNGRWDEGLPKLWLTHRALAVRAAQRDAFGPGSRGAYTAVVARGPHADRVVAYIRGGRVLVVVPRLVLTLGEWGETYLELPAGCWRDELAGLSVDGGPIRVGDLLARFPVGLLVLGDART